MIEHPLHAKSFPAIQVEMGVTVFHFAFHLEHLLEQKGYVQVTELPTKVYNTLVLPWISCASSSEWPVSTFESKVSALGARPFIRRPEGNAGD